MNGLAEWFDDSLGLVFVDGQREPVAERDHTVTYRVELEHEIDRFDGVLLTDESLEIPDGVFGFADIVWHARAPAWLLTELEFEQHSFDDVEELLDYVRPYSPKELDRSTEIDVLVFYPWVVEADGAAWDEVYEALEQWSADELSEQMAAQGEATLTEFIGETNGGRPGGVPADVTDAGDEDL